MKRVAVILLLAGVLGTTQAEAGLIRSAAKIAGKASKAAGKVGHIALRFIW